MAGWLERVLNANIAQYFGYASRSSQPRHDVSRALLTAPTRTEIPLCDEALRKIIRSLFGEPKRTIQDIVSLSMTCKRIRLISLRVCAHQVLRVFCGNGMRTTIR